MITEQLKRLVEKKVLETYVLAEKIFRQPLELCVIEYQINSKRIAGQAAVYKNIIRLNPDYLIENTDEMINVVIPHEIAHILTKKLYPNAKQAHGPEWKSIMIKLGLQPNPYHNMLIKKYSEFLYTCDCGRPFGLSRCRHNRILRGWDYTCPICKGKVRKFIN